MYFVLGQQLITFNRLLIIVVIGILTFFFDGGLMKKKGLSRESLWAKILGGLLIVGGIGGMVAVKIWG